MKIAIFHNLPIGGAKRALYEEMKYLSESNELHLYETKKQVEFLNVHKFAKKKYFYPFTLENCYPGFINRAVSDYKNLLLLNDFHNTIANEIDKIKYDLCLVHPDIFTQAPFVLRHIKTHSIYFCEEYLRICYEDHLKFNEEVIFLKKWYENGTRSLRKIIDRDNARAATKIVANSKFTKGNIDKAYGINAEYCQLGVDVDIFKPKVKRGDDHVLVMGEKNTIGSSGLAKDISDAVNNPELKFKALGSTTGKLAIRNDNILAKEYSCALAILCLSRKEPFGLSPLESMACETPVLAVDEGGYRETVIDGVTGYLLPRDPKAFANKIKFLMDNPEVARKMGKAGREHVKKNFTWEKHNKKLERILLKYARKEK